MPWGTQEAARPYQLVELDPQEERVVVYAGGEEGEITGKVQLGELEALVVPGIRENLVSISDLTSKGSTIELSDSGGVISNPINDKEINLKKKDGIWRLKLDDVATEIKAMLELSIQLSRDRRRTVILIFMNVWDINLGRL